MFGVRIGMGELLVILAVALIIYGPTNLPELGRSIGRALREFREASKDLSKSIMEDDESRTDAK